MTQSNNPNPADDDEPSASEKPDRGQLVPFPKSKVSKQNPLQSPVTKVLIWLWRQSKDLVFGDAKDLYGNVEVTPDLKKHAEMTNTIIVISNILNIIGIAPFIYLSFAGFGIVFASILTILMNACLLKFSNISGVAAANSRPEHRSWAFSGQLGFILISAFLTIFSGAGTVLFNDYSSIQQLKAQRLIDSNTVRIEALQHIPSPRITEVKQKIAALKVPKNNPLWETNEVLLNGTFEDRNKDWSKVPFNSLPLTKQELILEQKNLSLYEEAQAKWQNQLLKRSESGSDLTFLKENQPRLYDANFLTDGTLRSSAESVAIANDIFTKQLVTLKWSELGFAFLFMGVSIITSGTACYMAYTYAKRGDVQNSRDPKRKRLRNQAIRLLREKIQRLQEKRQNQDEQ
jgi:hypothetical protein